MTHSELRGDLSQPEETTVRRRSDLRTIIGGVFTVYGLVLTVTGLLDSPSEVAKANGIRINLWLGLCMLALGLLFLLWVRLRPMRLEASPAAARAEETAPPGADRPPAEGPGTDRPVEDRPDLG